MNNISIDLIISISLFLDYISIVNLRRTNSNFLTVTNNIIIKQRKNAINKILRFFYKIKKNYSDLRMNRDGYLINYNKLYKHPEEYLNKKIQFVSTFQYYHYNLRKGEIGEGYLNYHKNTDSWFFELDNSFYQYLPGEPLPLNHLLYYPFISNKSLRVIKD